MKIKSYVLLLAMLVGFVFVSGCSEDDEQKAMGEAQACLDQVADTDVDAANDCLSFVEGYDSEEAMAIKCAIKFVAGGITTTKIIDAAEQLNDGDNQEEVFMSILVFNGRSNNTATQAIANVTDAASDCNDSGVEGLQFLANFSVAGTVLMATLDAITSSIDWSNPQVSSSDLSGSSQFGDALEDCATGESTCDTETVGEAIIALSDSYCDESNQDEDICQDVSAAVEGGGDADAVGQAFFEQLQD